MSSLRQIIQASTDMSSLRRLVGKGMGSIAVEAVLWEFCLLCPAAHRCPLTHKPALA